MSELRTIINDKQVDVNKLFPYKYAWAKEYLDNESANHWVPEEIPLQKDLEQWKAGKLTDNEQLMFLRNLGFFASAESLVSNNLVLSIFKFVTDPMCRGFLIRQAYTELIHTLTFSYITDTLDIDSDYVFNMYNEIPSIKAKADFEMKYTEMVLKPDFNTDTNKGIRDFLTNLIAYYICLEGILFYSGFAMNLSLKNRNLMPGVGSLYELIMRDECYSVDTEVLTTHGWKYVNQITTEDTILTYNKDSKKTEWQKPIKTSKHHELYLWHFENNYLDQFVSNRHRMCYYRKLKDGSENFKVKVAADTNPNDDHFFINSAPVDYNGEYFITAFEKFLIAFQADGSFGERVNHNGKRTGLYNYDFGLKKIKKIHELSNIFNELKIIYPNIVLKEFKIRNDGLRRFQLQIPKEVVVLKTFEWMKINRYSFDKCKKIVEYITFWDGHKRSENNVIYCSTNKICIDKAQAIATLAGYKTKIIKNVDNRKGSYKDYYRLSIIKNINYTKGGCITKDKVSYNDNVYAIQVPNSFIVTRREDKVSITGNCQHLGFGIDLINTIVDENKHIWSESFQQSIYNMVDESVKLEIAYAKDTLPIGIVGLNANMFETYIKYIADRRLERINLKKQYFTNNPFPWLSEVMDLDREKNFFETKATEYQSSASLKW